MASIESHEVAAGKRYRVRYRTPDHRQTDKRGFKSKRDAEAFLATVEVSKLRGDWVDPARARLKMDAWAGEWLAAQAHLKPTTQSGYRHYCERYVVPQWGRYSLADVTHSQVQAWVNQLSNELSASSVRQIFLVLSGMFKFAVKDGRLTKNPCADTNLPRVQKRPRGYLTHDQVATLAQACGADADVILTLAYTGLRWGELAALRVTSVDFLRRRLRITEAVSEPRGEVIWGTPKTHEHRSVPFPDFIATLLAKRCEGKGRGDVLFSTREGAVLRGSNFRTRVFDRALAEVRGVDNDFPKVTPHDLRHTAASLAISAGANVKGVQRMLGHASAAMTLDVYADLFDDDLDAVAGALNHMALQTNVGKLWATPTRGAISG